MTQNATATTLVIDGRPATEQEMRRVFGPAAYEQMKAAEEAAEEAARKATFLAAVRRGGDIGCTSDFEQNLIAQYVAQATREEQEDAWEQEHAAWLCEMGLDRPMTAQEVESVARYELAYVA